MSPVLGKPQYVHFGDLVRAGSVPAEIKIHAPGPVQLREQRRNHPVHHAAAVVGVSPGKGKRGSVLSAEYGFVQVAIVTVASTVSLYHGTPGKLTRGPGKRYPPHASPRKRNR